MGQEFSAGVILFRTRSDRRYLILDYGSHWDFPKGHVEAGEAPETTALRELAEETGIRDVRPISGFTEQMRYFYRRAGQRVTKVVIYFLAETDTEAVVLSHEHCGYAWLPFAEAQTRLTFRSARELLASAERFLNPRPS
jgi:8-oxo-dGTP pyrophosphatase MutT (NUDIX family)